jgi:hypothetical protein
MIRTLSLKNFRAYLLSHEIIIIDEKGHIRHEWTESCCGQQDEFLKQWINNRIVENKIQERPTKSNSAIRVRLREFGVPPKDHKYFYLAVANKSDAIASDDIDFYDPTEKTSSSARKEKIKNNRRGPVCKFFQKQNIFIFPLHLTFNFI